MKTNFNEKTLHEFENLTNGTKLAKFNRSKPLQLWLKFFSDCFGLNIDLKDALIFKRFPGASMILVPKEITLTKCLETLKGTEIATNLKEEKVSLVRRKNTTYLLYHQKYHPLTLLEELIWLLFQFYKTGRLSFSQTHYTCSKYDDKEITIGVSKGKEKDYCIEMWYLN